MEKYLGYVVSAMLIAIVALASVVSFQCSRNKSLENDLSYERLVTKQNIKAMTDSITKVKNKDSSSSFNRAAYVGDIDQIKEMNKKLYSDIARLNGSVLAYMDAHVSGSTGSIVVDNGLNKYDGGEYGLSFKGQYADSGLSLKYNGESRFKLNNGVIYPGTTKMDDINFKLKLGCGFTKLDDGTYKASVTSSSGRIVIDQLDGAILNIPKPAPSKPKRFGISAQAGVYYCPFVKSIQPGIGIGGSYLLWP